MLTRKCRKCKKILGVEQFNFIVGRTGKVGLTTYCTICLRLVNKNWRDRRTQAQIKFHNKAATKVKSRKCIRCHKKYPGIDFQSFNTIPCLVQTCKYCRLEKQKYTKKEKETDLLLCASYGITLPMYKNILRKQNYRCAICRKKPNKKRLSVDHNHKTGKVRGLLCYKCNTGLGMLRDNPYIVQQALEYLKTH